MTHKNNIYVRLFLVLLFVGAFSVPSITKAATLRLSPETGVYTLGNTFTVIVGMNTQSKPVNAADAQITFNPKELAVVGVNKGNSIFTLWTLEPTFSNTAGTVSFGGGSPSGYTGGNGTIMSITFKTLGAGTPKVNFKTGSILAADGLGTNVLTTMSGGTYTVQAQSVTPPPEYVPPASTPGAPQVKSTTHPDTKAWYQGSDASLTWTLPNGITAVRTLLDTLPSTVPTIVYDTPISYREITDLPQGTSYFHIQFKNEDGWGRITHFALNRDSEKPTDFTIREENADISSPARTLVFELKDISPILKYTIQIDGASPIEFIDTEQKKRYVLKELSPGHHTVVVEAFDSAGNSAVTSYSFDVSTFEAPIFTEWAERINAGVIPAFRGTTRGEVTVEVTVSEGSREFGVYTIESNKDGLFTFIPDSKLPVGVYDIVAVAYDKNGAQSEPSKSIRVIVEEPGYITLGSYVVRVLSVLVPLVALSILLIFGSWFLWYRLRRWKGEVLVETLDAESKLKLEFDTVVTKLHEHVSELKEVRKVKLTRAELDIIETIEADLRSAQARLRKEITDIENIVE